jgi:hypothetical protein
MTISRSKTTATAIAIFLMLTIAATLIALPIVSAQTNREQPNFIYVTAQPLTGIGQNVFISYFTDRLPIDVGEVAGLLPGRAHWSDIKLIITKPDGTNETIAMGNTDPVGGGWLSWASTAVGEYSVTAYIPGQWKNTSTYNTWYPAAQSYPAKFTVQQEPVLQWPEVPLPDDYWMRPISGNANSWSILASNWLGGAANNYPQGASGGVPSSYGYGTGPESPHILWTRQYFPTGDIEDTRFGTIGNRYGGYQAVGYTCDPILDGMMHVQVEKTVHDGSGAYEIWDLKTGELLYTNETQTKPAFGQIYWYDTGNEHGLNVYLWKTSGITLPQVVRVPRVKYLGPNRLPLRLAENIEINRTATPTAINVTGTLREILDAYTGKTICYIANASTAGTEVRGKRDGSILYYNAFNYGTTAAPNYYLQVWNSSAGTMVASQANTGAWQWRPSGGSGSGASISYFGAVGSDCVHDGNIMWSLNVSMPSILGPRNTLANQTATIQAVREGEYIIFGTTGRNDERGLVQGWMMGVSLELGKEGQKLWETTFTPPLSNSNWYQQVGFVGVRPEQEVIVYNSETELLNPIVFDLKSGTKLWQGNASIEPQYSFYGYQTLFYEDLIITGGAHSGVITAYEARTGAIRWQYTATQIGTESPYGNDLARGFTVADGKLYTSVSEHSPSSPLWRTPGLKCFNITTGEEIWKIAFWGSGIKFADGILTTMNLYDGQVYAFGKGPSGTTVSAPQTIPALGSSVTITGTVTDQTPTGRRNVNNLVQFTLKDTPAISDEDMRRWMEYKFMGQGKPANAKGVEVTLDAIDPNNNYIHIGTVTSDLTGAYGFVWQPEVPGTYQIIATFAGTKSYYGSSTTTYLTVGEAPPTPAEPQPLPAQLPLDMYLLYATVAIIVAIAIVGLLILRKK